MIRLPVPAFTLGATNSVSLKIQNRFFPFFLGVLCGPLGPSWSAPGPLEAPEQRAARHEQVARRRAGTPVICHRGAAEFGIENTLAAYEAALRLGADGVEIDLRRTRDGVLVLFHDDMLDRLTDGLGTVSDLSYAELRLLRFNPEVVPPRRSRRRPSSSLDRPPTFRELLCLAARHAALLHLDVKEPGLEEAILRELEAADAFDQVVALSPYNTERLRRDPRFHLLPYRGGTLEDGSDLDPAAIRRLLARPGRMIMVDDPRLALTELGRPVGRADPLTEDGSDDEFAPDHLPDGTRLTAADLMASVCGAAGEKGRLQPRDAAARLALAYPSQALRLLPRRDPRARPVEARAAAAAALGWASAHRRVPAPARRLLLALLADEAAAVREAAARACGPARIKEAIPALLRRLDETEAIAADLTPDPARQAERAGLIRERAAIAGALGEMGDARPEVVAALIRCLEHRGLHRDWMFHGLDGGIAARSLGRLRAATAVPTLVAAARRDDPALDRLNEGGADAASAYPRSWRDFRLKMYAPPALAAIGAPAARQALLELAALSEVEGRALGSTLPADALSPGPEACWKHCSEIHPPRSAARRSWRCWTSPRPLVACSRGMPPGPFPSGDKGRV